MDALTRSTLEYANKLYKAGRKREAIEILNKVNHPSAQRILLKLASPRQFPSTTESIHVNIVRTHFQKNWRLLCFLFIVSLLFVYMYGYVPARESRDALLISGGMIVSTGLLIAIRARHWKGESIGNTPHEVKAITIQETNEPSDLVQSQSGFGCSANTFRVLFGILLLFFVISLGHRNLIVNSMALLLLSLLMVFRSASAQAERDHQIELERVAYIDSMREVWGNDICNILLRKEITLGMTESMVTAGWGKPRYTDQVEININKEKHRWVYNNPRVDARYVTFTNGIVSVIKTT